MTTSGVIMEHRTWKRDSVALDVEIRMWRRDGEEVVNCKTLDIGLGGAELLTYNATFPKHRVLEVRFAQMHNMKLRQTRILAKFLRKTQDGVAIQFTKANNETLMILQRLILKDKMSQTKSRPRQDNYNTA